MHTHTHTRTHKSTLALYIYEIALNFIANHRFVRLIQQRQSEHMRQNATLTLSSNRIHSIHHYMRIAHHSYSYIKIRFQCVSFPSNAYSVT